MKKGNSKSVRPWLVLCGALLVMCAQARGQGSGVLRIHNRSAFNSIDARNPFWPVGYVPGTAAPAPGQTAAPKSLIKAEDFTLTSISSFAGTRMATVCGKSVAEGDLVKVTLGGQPVKVQVVQVTDGSVVLRYAGQEVTVVLKRPELDLTTRPVKAEPLLHSQEE